MVKKENKARKCRSHIVRKDGKTKKERTIILLNPSSCPYSAMYISFLRNSWTSFIPPFVPLTTWKLFSVAVIYRTIGNSWINKLYVTQCDSILIINYMNWHLWLIIVYYQINIKNSILGLIRILNNDRYIYMINHYKIEIQ